MNTYETMFYRKSIRSFKNERIDWDIISDILDYANEIPMISMGISIEFKLVSNIEAQQGFTNPFNMNAPYYICLSSEKKEDYLLNAGYVMQQLNLYIASKGLGTCFLGYANPGKSLKKTMKFDYIIALAFGKTDKPLYRENNSAKRLPEEALVVYKEEVPSEIKQLISAARLAPSSYNIQPWRFVAYRNRIHVFAKKNFLIAKALDGKKMIDIGIAMANLLLAAEELWIETSITQSEIMMNKQFQNNEYVLTVLIG